MHSERKGSEPTSDDHIQGGQRFLKLTGPFLIDMGTSREVTLR